MLVKEISKKKFETATELVKEETKKRIAKMQKEGDKMVKGMFEFTDAMGGWLDFSYRFFKGEPVRTVHIVHGEICEVPILLAKHLNNVYKKVRIPANNLDKDAPLITKISRTRFTPFDMLSDNVIGI
jgi:hypothetical protein